MDVGDQAYVSVLLELACYRYTVSALSLNADEMEEAKIVQDRKWCAVYKTKKPV